MNDLNDIQRLIKEAQSKIDFFMKLAHTNKDILAQAVIEFTSQYLKNKYERKTSKDKQTNRTKSRERNHL